MIRTITRFAARRTAESKVPEISLAFWVAKILSTAMGEATSDFLVFHTNPYAAVAAGAVGFFAALGLQMTLRRYRPLAYWVLVVMVSVFGTMIADVIHVVLGVPYGVSSAGFLLALGAILLAWYRSEGTLSIHSIRSPRREGFYWATVMATFALGTAAGDLTASTFGLGYWPSALLFTALFAVPGLLYAAGKLNPIAGFWTAYILTRPMGASFADWVDKPVAQSGLGYGTPLTSAVLSAAVALAVGYIMLRYRRGSLQALA